MVIERDADDVARCFLLERDMYEGGWDTVYDGEVTGLIGAGAFVTFGDGYQGMLPVRRLRGDWWELNEQGTMLIGDAHRRRHPPRRPRDGRRAPGRRAARARGPRPRRHPGAIGSAP